MTASGENLGLRAPQPTASNLTGASDDATWRRLEATFARFEDAWQNGPPRWEDFVETPDVPSHERALLARELVKIDLDYRWRTATLGTASRLSIQTAPAPSRFDDLPLRPTLEAYCERALELPSISQMPLDLASEEYRVRKRYGDAPRVEEYTARFPHLANELPNALRNVDRDLATETRVLPTAKRRKLGRYELIEQIGQGSFGVVWKAWDPQLRREVAVKLPRGGAWLTADAERRFVREACATARLAHEGIVSIHDVGRDQDTFFLVAELVPGTTLSEWLEKNRPTPEQSIEIVARLAEALDFAHRAGVIHRDIKPSNVMLDLRARGVRTTSESGDGAPSSTDSVRSLPHRPRGVELPFRPRIMDFGLAKREAGDTTMTRDGHLLGTPAYMSPEQFRDPHAVDGRSDVYSLGVMLYQLLTGKPPFQGETHTVLAMVQTALPPPPHKFVERLPPGADAIVMKCLAKRPDDRYWTAGELADDLRRSLANETLRAAGDRSFSDYVRRTVVSPWAVIVLPTLAILAAVVGYGIASRFAARSVASAESRDDPSREQSPGETPPDDSFASLRSDAIDDAERHAEMPGELVAVVGESRQRHWAPAVRVLHLPQRDVIVTASGDGDVHLWRHDLEARRLFEEDSFWAHDGAIEGLVSLDDGRIIATGGSDGVTRLWEVNANPRVAWEVIRGDAVGEGEESWTVRALAAAPNAMRLAIVTQRGVTVWDVSGPARRIASIPAEDAFDAAFVGGADKLLVARPRETTLWRLDVAAETACLTPCDRFATCRFDRKAKTPRSLSRTGAKLAQRRRQAASLSHVFVSKQQSEEDDDKFSEEDREESEPEESMEESPEPAQDGEREGQDGEEDTEEDSPPERPPLPLEDSAIVRVWKNEASDWRRFAAQATGSLFAIAGDDGFVSVWSVDDPENAKPRHRFEPEGAACLAFAPNRAELLVGTTDGQAKAWNLAGAEARQSLFAAEIHAGEIASLAPSGDGRFLYTVGGDHTVRAFDRSTNKATPLDGHVGPINHARFLGAEGKTLATWSTADLALRLWNVDQGRLIETAKIDAAADPLRIAPLPGDTFALAQTKGYISLWKPDGTSTAMTFSPQLPNLLALSGQTDSDRVVLATNSGRIYLWTPGQPTPLVIRPGVDEGDPITSVTFASSGETAALVAQDGALLAVRCGHDVPETERERSLLEANEGAVSLPTISDDGQQAAAVVDGSTLRLWQVENGAPIGEPLQANVPITAVAFSPDGATLVVVQADGSVRRINTATGKSLGETVSRHSEKPVLRFAPDGHWFAIADADGRATLWNTKKARMVREWRFDGSILDLAFSPDSRHLTTSNANGTAYVLRLPGG